MRVTIAISSSMGVSVSISLVPVFYLGRWIMSEAKMVSLDVFWGRFGRIGCPKKCSTMQCQLCLSVSWSDEKHQAAVPFTRFGKSCAVYCSENHLCYGQILWNWTRRTIWFRILFCRKRVGEYSKSFTCRFGTSLYPVSNSQRGATTSNTFSTPSDFHTA